MIDNEYLLYEIKNNVAVITLNQPDSMNAISPEFAQALETAIDYASKDAGAIVLLGSDRAFSSGANLKTNRFDQGNTEIDVGINLETVYNPFLSKLTELSIPLIVGVRGAAAGIGCSIALMGDIIIAGRSAFFLQAFCNIGLVPDGGAAFLLAKSVGRVKAMELMLLGERYPAEHALQDGLITRMVEDDEVIETAMKYADKLAKGPSKALAMIRKSAWAALDSSFNDQLKLERKLQKTAGLTQDFKEGVAAFREKRKPNFTGQ
jgi:2-(1,2-epoxy-1,2-dihydrophenyl)acetyl-CoA isomerase